LLLTFVVTAAGCGSSDGHNAGGSHIIKPFTGTHPIKAVCTTGMVADMVRQIGGKWVEVDQIMGEGIDPHLFKATPDVIARLHKADIIFYSGLHLEGRMVELFEDRPDDKPTVALTSAIAESRLIGAGEGAHDPHVWFDVALWSETAEAVRGALVEFDPPHASDFDSSAKSYRAELAGLDAECRNQIATIPPSVRVMVTAHDAFHYFGRAYGIEVKAIQGVSTETEAGVREINQLNDFIVQRKIKAVFVETSVNERNIEALVEGCKQRGHDVRIGGTLYSDSMGAAGTPEGTYVGMVRHNVKTIVDSLR
jgi:manganese/zinc/iron transport system substrate-binding protein